ncbi:hypothetical protein KSP39_PZI019191 [Platanthera zijinensis]|uniref:Reverse transcriptase Ty1/copia-type domain-containing protein n=1 Tax=Platanthera zijinensis TaxID=2320716 RepID=A0AAP0B255_9ASPA
MRSRYSIMERSHRRRDELSHADHHMTLVDLPKGAKIIGNKWVLRKNLNPDGSIAKYKARLVAKGFTQVSGVDYFDIYSSVCHYATIRILLALASIEYYTFYQMDVKTAFLNGDLTEEICMHQPEGFFIEDLKNKVCKLIMSLYGLKQAPKMWHEKFDTCVKDLSFKSSLSDKCLYVRTSANKVVIICLYVDDMLSLGTDQF